MNETKPELDSNFFELDLCWSYWWFAWWNATRNNMITSSVQTAGTAAFWFLQQQIPFWLFLEPYLNVCHFFRLQWQCLSVFLSIWLKVTFHNIDNVALCTQSNKAAAQRRLQQAHNAACVATVCSSQRSSQTQTVPPKEFWEQRHFQATTSAGNNRDRNLWLDSL